MSSVKLPISSKVPRPHFTRFGGEFGLRMFNSELSYTISASTRVPFTLPKGTRVDAEIVYDNSELNMRNPNSPPKRVKWGLGTFDEMGSLTLLLTTTSRQDDRMLRQISTQHFREQLAAMFLQRR